MIRLTFYPVATKKLLVAGALLIASCPLSAQLQLPIMPLPALMTPGTGSFSIDAGFRFVTQGYNEPRIDRAKQRFLASLAQETGILHLPAPTPTQPLFIIKPESPSTPVQQLGEVESYHLEVTPTLVVLSAPNPLGILHGLQTFLQLVRTTPKGFVVDAVVIDDKPRFPWRGLMLDTGRHFMPLDTVKQTLDGMEAVKLNVFHWHLSEDQGFRVESKSFPLLQKKGSDGLFYTRQQVQDILGYARDRGIRIVPEFDMPGHASAWFVGYPQLASGNGPYHIERKWGVFDPAMDPTRESTYAFLNTFVAEMTELFPDDYFHIGGDECNGKEWDANPRIQAYMREHKLKDNAALQAYFTSRVQNIVTKHHKIAVGWDEVLQPDTPKDVVIQSWRGQDSLAAAARGGYRGLLSAGYYIDLNEPAVEHYSVDPIENATASLTADQQAHILGGETTMWSEFTTPEIVASRIWPRTAAIAERLWSPQSTKDIPSMYQRLALVSENLNYRGLTYKSTSDLMLQRMAGDADISALKVLANVVEPPKGYDREGLLDYDVFTPLNRMVDAVPPESDTARMFRDLANRIADGSATTQEKQKAREWLILWRDNDAQLQANLPQHALTADLAGISRGLAEAATIGLTALNHIEQHESVAAVAKEDQLTTLKKLEAPQAVLLDRIVPGVETLVKATKP